MCVDQSVLYCHIMPRLTLTFLLVTFMFLYVILAEDDLTFLILHTSNILGIYDAYNKSKSGHQVGGYGRIATVVKQARDRHKAGKAPPAIYLDTGNIFTGSAWFALHRHKIVTELMNSVVPDAICLGNHEFDHGIRGLLPFLENIKFPVVASNYKFNKENALKKLLKETVVLTLNGRKIGIIGYLSMDAKQASFLGDIELTDEVYAVKRISRDLTEQGVNIIIAMGHSEYRINRRIAKFVKEVDVVVGGHDHIFQWNGKSPDIENATDPYPRVLEQKYGKIVPVVEGYAFAKYVGMLKVTFDKNGNLKYFGGQPIFLDESTAVDANISVIIEKYRAGIDNLGSAIGKTKVLLDGESCKMQGCNFGNMVMDAFIRHRAARCEGPYWTDAAIALMNAGAVRDTINASIKADQISRIDILSALPYTQPLHIIELTGVDLLQVMEISAREHNKNAFLLTSGMRVIYVLERSTLLHIKSVEVRCANCEIPEYFPLENDTVYRIITTEFIAGGGDGYSIIKERSQEQRKIGTDFDAVVEYFLSASVVLPEVDERIFIEYSYD